MMYHVFRYFIIQLGRQITQNKRWKNRIKKKCMERMKLIVFVIGPNYAGCILPMLVHCEIKLYYHGLKFVQHVDSKNIEMDFAY